MSYYSYWINLSKRGEKDGVFQALAGLLRGAARPDQGKPCPSRLFYSDFHSFYDRSPHWHWFLKSIEASVLVLLNPYWPSWICIGPPEIYRRGILIYPIYYVRKALQKPIWNITLPSCLQYSLLFLWDICFVTLHCSKSNVPQYAKYPVRTALFI